jgi:hypothetical protein
MEEINMKKDFLEKLKAIGILILYSLPVLLLIAYIAVWIYAHVEFGNLPITDVPSWAIPFLTGGK